MKVFDYLRQDTILVLPLKQSESVSKAGIGTPKMGGSPSWLPCKHKKGTLQTAHTEVAFWALSVAPFVSA